MVDAKENKAAAPPAANKTEVSPFSGLRPVEPDTPEYAAHEAASQPPVESAPEGE